MKKTVAVLAPEIHPPFIEGVQKTAWSFIRGFLEHSVAVDVYTQKSFGDDLGEEVADLRVYNFFSTFFVRPVKYATWVGQSVVLVSKLLRHRPQHLLVFSLDLPFFFPLFLISIVIKSLPVTISLFSAREIEGVGKWFMCFFGNRFTRFIVRSEYMRSRLQQLGVLSEKIVLELPFPHKERFNGETRTERDFHTIAYLSNVDVDAGALTMLDLAEQLPEYRIIMAVRKFADSYEKEVEKFVQKIAERKLRNVELVRNIGDIADFYKKIGVVVVPVIDERATMDMPMVLVEALASGTNVVVNRLPIFEPLVAGGLVEYYSSVSELADRIRNAPNTYLQYAGRGLSFTKRLPTMNESVQHYLEYMDCI